MLWSQCTSSRIGGEMMEEYRMHAGMNSGHENCAVHNFDKLMQLSITSLTGEDLEHCKVHPEVSCMSNIKP